MQRISLTPTDSLLNSNYTSALDANKTLTHISPQHLNETPKILKSANLSCIPNSTKSQNLNKHQKEQTATETKHLRAEMIALKSFVVDQIYMLKKYQMIKMTNF